MCSVALRPLSSVIFKISGGTFSALEGQLFFPPSALPAICMEETRKKMKNEGREKKGNLDLKKTKSSTGLKKLKKPGRVLNQY